MNPVTTKVEFCRPKNINLIQECIPNFDSVKDMDMIYIYLNECYLCPTKRKITQAFVRVLIHDLIKGKGAISSLIHGFSLSLDDACDIQNLYTKHFKSKDPKPVNINFWDKHNIELISATTINKKTTIEAGTLSEVS